MKLLYIFSLLEICKHICATEVLGKLIFRDNSYSNNEISNEKMLKSNKNLVKSKITLILYYSLIKYLINSLQVPSQSNKDKYL